MANTDEQSLDVRNGRDNCFDFLRLIAALTVVVRHYVDFLHTPFLWFRDTTTGYWFYDGVPLFFVLSGFLVYRSYNRIVERGLPARAYFANRFLRIAPALYVYMAVMIVLTLAIGALSLKHLASLWGALWILCSLVFYPEPKPTVFPRLDHGIINPSLWTIPAEVSFYLVVPLIFILHRRCSARVTFALIIGLGIVGAVAQGNLEAIKPHPLIEHYFPQTFLPYLTLFGLGILWTVVWPRVPNHWGIASGAFAVYFLLRVLDPLNIQGWRPTLFAHTLPQVLVYITWTFSFSYAAIWFALNGPRLLRRITPKIGDLSYGIYIWHFVFIDLALYFGLKEKLSFVPAGVFLFVVGMTVVAAILSWHLIERPALRRKPFDKHSERSARGRIGESPYSATGSVTTMSGLPEAVHD